MSDFTDRLDKAKSDMERKLNAKRNLIFGLEFEQAPFQIWRSLRRVFYHNDKTYRVILWRPYDGFYITNGLNSYTFYDDTDIRVSPQWVFDNVLSEENQEHAIFNMDVFMNLNSQKTLDGDQVTL
jgi:hypothetical protein